MTRQNQFDVIIIGGSYAGLSAGMSLGRSLRKAIEAKKIENGFEIITENGEKFNSKKLIIATGIIDEIPNIKGFQECWGISLIHCPYCHGYEFKNKKTGIIANGERGFHISSLVNNLTKDITIFTRGKADFTEEQFQKLEKNNIKIIETKIEELKHQNGNIESLMLSDGKDLIFETVYG